MKRLKGETGEIVDPAKRAGDSDARVVRSAILVHAGPNGEKSTFQSGDGEIAFDEARIKRIVENVNAELIALGEQYGGFDKIPDGAMLPVLDQHADDSNNRIVGRFASKLRYEVRDVPKVGKNVPCAVADLAFLGEDTVKRVNDGRIYHLSIGIDENTDTLGEVSTVIEPAAPGAMLLKKKGAETRVRLKKGEDTMSATQRLKRAKASAKRLAALSNMSEGLKKLSSDLKGNKEVIKLTQKKGDITHRLMGLMKAGKLTPAEYKKLSIEKLAKLPDEAVETLVSSFEIREPQINPNQKGSTEAIEFTELAKNMDKKNQKRLKAEIMGDFKRMSGGSIKMKEGFEDPDDKEMSGPKEQEIKTPHDPHSIPESEGDSELKAKFAKHMHDMGKHLEAGDVEKAKQAHYEAMKHMEEHGDKHMSLAAGDVKSEDYKAGMSALEERVDEMGTQLARFAGMVSELMDVEKEEGHDLEKEGEEEDKAKLAAEIEEGKK